VLAVLTPEQMAAADRTTIAAGTPSLTLMERAGIAVARAAARATGGTYGRRVLVLAGKGNNGGDGLVAARHLAARGAFPVVVFPDDPGTLKGDARTNLERLRNVRQLRFDERGFARELGRADVVVDALYGTGFKGALAGPPAQAVTAVNRSGLPVVAVDIPSGVDGMTGRVDGPAIRATTTVTMAALKLGIVFHPGSEYAGEVEVADIGIATPQFPKVVGVPEAADVARVLGHRPLDAHKRSVGTAMVVAGSVGMSGAAALAATGALRSGAGLVTIASPASVVTEVHPRVLEATSLRLPETSQGTVAAGALELLLDKAATVDAVAIGPGLSTNPETVDVVRKTIAALENPLVADADALNALAGDPGILEARGAPTAITPHPGELSRLLGISTAAIQADRLGAARRAAERFQSAVVLKGYRSIVADPSGATVIITTGGPALATGGTGDVLTGVTVALLAGGADPFTAAWAASWLHGRAGDVLERLLGARGTIAGDVPAAVAGVMHDLETSA
jgi:ADP-dependent NAD(P)H-hydrate dehydratase / NAD(P)H-hydrate epimerase